MGWSRLRDRFSIVTRLLAGGLVLTAAVWFVLDIVHSGRIAAMSRSSALRLLDMLARGDQVRLKESLRAHAAAAAIPTTSSMWNGVAGFLFVLDDGGRIGSAARPDRPVPPGLSEWAGRIAARAEEETFFDLFGGDLYLISNRRLGNGPSRAILLSRLDSRWLEELAGGEEEGGHVALLADIRHGVVALSGDPARIPPGTPLSALTDWFAVVRAFPAHGGVRLMPGLVSLLSKDQALALAQPLLREERDLRAMLVLVLSGFFLGVLLLLALRLRRIIALLSAEIKTVSALPSPPFQGGDELAGLAAKVRTLVAEVLRSRQVLAREGEEKLRLIKERIETREEIARLRLLQSVTDLMGVGVLRLTEAGPTAENRVMVDFALNCGGLRQFLHAHPEGDGLLTLTDLGGDQRIFQVRSADTVDSGLLLVADVTQQRRAENMVHSLALFPAQSPYPVLRIGADGIILHANPASDPLLGEWATGVGRAVPPEWRMRVVQVVRSGRQMRTELFLDGQVLALTLAPVAGADYANIYAADVSDRVRAERQLAIANEDLERRVAERTCDLARAKELAELANRAKTEFLATISHELRTPLNAIIGFSEIMQSGMFGPLANARYQAYAGDIIASGRHLLSVINDILDVSKIEAGQMELDCEDVRLTEVIDAAVRLMEGRARAGQLRMIVEVGADVPSIIADRRRCLQILVNLLSNAIKFTPEGGRVSVQCFLDDGGVRLRVSDTGIGMSEAEIPVALEPFRQVDGSLGRRYEGTGLGLPLSKSLVELHGGSLGVCSRKGEGTEVSIWLPLIQEDPLSAWVI